MSLDQIAAAAAEAKRLDVRQSVARMADELEKRRHDERPTYDITDQLPHRPEQLAPMDWLLREAIAKAKASQGLAEEPKEPEHQAYYTIEDTD